MTVAGIEPDFVVTPKVPSVRLIAWTASLMITVLACPSGDGPLQPSRI